jgi:hypothetical protein
VEAETRPIWTNAVDSYTPYLPAEYGRTIARGKTAFKDFRVTLWRWRDDFQNDFAARMDWTVRPRDKANHPPIPALAHPDRLTVRSGERFVLDAGGTRDPDGDSLSYLWFHYPEAGTLQTPIKLDAAENLQRVTLVAPQVAKAETAHFILRVTDKGQPALSRYKRVIVTLTQK